MIQIFGTNKCIETKKTLMFFKERRIEFSFIDLRLREISIREFDSIYANFKDINCLINLNSKLYKEFYLAHLERTYEQYRKLLTENYDLLKTPINRAKNKALIGYDKEKLEMFCQLNK